MNMALIGVLTTALIIFGSATNNVEAAGMGSAAARAAMNRMLAREAARDAATIAVPLRRGLYLPRYATRQEAAAEAQKGLRAGQHLVGPLESKGILSSQAASARYGLQHKTPEVREMWYVPKGTPTRVNPVWGGSHGASEATLTRPLPPRNLTHVAPLPSQR